MTVWTDAIRRTLPEPIGRRFDKLETLQALGIFRDPLTLARQWRYRHKIAKLQEAFLWQRYVTAILQAHEAGVWPVLQRGPASPAEVAAAAGIHPRAAEALLYILEAAELVVRRRGKFAATAFAREYLAGQGPFSLAPMLDLLAAQAGAFGEAVAGMRSGTVPPGIDIMRADSRYRSFLIAVNAFLSFAAPDLLARLGLRRVEHAIVGSMGVSFSAALLDRFPNARVTYGCLPHLVREIPALTRQYKVPLSAIAGMHEHSGDPFADRWGDESFDLVFLTKKMILAPEVRMGERFAAKAFEVLRPGGAAIFWETLYRDRGPTPLPRALEGVLDLGASPTGLVNTERRMTRTLRDIGYQRVRIVPVMAGQTTFAVGFKPAR